MCPHPEEEHQRVFEGRPLPLPGRMLCGLCGELLYLPPAAAPAAAVVAAIAPRPRVERAAASRE
ncbi:MAG: hypothetical protein HY875_12960 [Chloroflexi bacterium]|nr:hypothetical protein [Chloroflexota bacterium]